MSKAKLAIALGTLSVAVVAWAIPVTGIAQQLDRQSGATRAAVSMPIGPIRLRDQRDRGLLASGWINGAGPFVFAIDTGAGVSLISRSVAERTGLRVVKSRRPLVGGLSTAPISSNQETQIPGLALGSPHNTVAGRVNAAVVASLPGSIDGILDPTEVFKGFVYSVDLPNRELRVYDAATQPLRLTSVPRDGAVVRWAREAGSNRPFVRLEDGRLALVDTGSGFGLALTAVRVVGGANHKRQDATHDLGGGMIQSRPIGPQNVSIGSLVLNGVPTDVLTGVAPGTPIILGRRALFPFKITFDPVSRLIAFEPTIRD